MAIPLLTTSALGLQNMVVGVGSQQFPSAQQVLNESGADGVGDEPAREPPFCASDIQDDLQRTPAVRYQAMSSVDHVAPPPGSVGGPGENGQGGNRNGDGKTMKNEHIFNEKGFYPFVVRSNAITHREAIEHGKALFESWLQGRMPDAQVHVLDLACGGLPVTIAEIMRAFPEVVFSYTGIDSNADQVRKAHTEFNFPENVTNVHVIQGDAWDLDSLALRSSYDLVFSGLNFHHGTPEELAYLGSRIVAYLASDGLLLSHDIYRPHQIPYLRRPDRNPHDSADTYTMVDKQRLHAVGFDGAIVAEVSRGDAVQDDWRTDFIEGLNAFLIEKGADPRDVEVNARHVQRRDFPVSLNEASLIFSTVGLRVEVVDFSQTAHPLGKYFGMISGRK